MKIQQETNVLYHWQDACACRRVEGNSLPSPPRSGGRRGATWAQHEAVLKALTANPTPSFSALKSLSLTNELLALTYLTLNESPYGRQAL
jgi:hypothetical protein